MERPSTERKPNNGNTKKKAEQWKDKQQQKTDQLKAQRRQKAEQKKYKKDRKS